MPLNNNVNTNYYLFFDKDRIPALQEALRITSAIIICLLIARFLNFSSLHWCMMTIPILYIGTTQGLALKRAYHRCLGTTFAIILGYILLTSGFTSCPMITYITIATLWFLSFYTYYLTDCYAIACALRAGGTFIMITAMAPQYANLNMTDTMFARIIDNVLAASVVVFCELTIFPQATNGKSNLRTLSRKLINESAEALEMIIDSFCNEKELPRDRQTIQGILGDQAQMNKIFKSLEYEFINKTNPESFMEYRTIMENLLEELIAMASYTALTETRGNIDNLATMKASGNIISDYLKQTFVNPDNNIIEETHMDNLKEISINDKNHYTRLFCIRLLKYADLAQQLNRYLVYLKQ